MEVAIGISSGLLEISLSLASVFQITLKCRLHYSDHTELV
jgi:hypothetical protein